MTIVSSGAISINSLVGEYGGSAPHSMSEYYKGGSLVANHSNNPNVPTSGTISLSNFYGANNSSPDELVCVITVAQSSIKYGEEGYDSTGGLSNFGSISDSSLNIGGTSYTVTDICSNGDFGTFSTRIYTSPAMTSSTLSSYSTMTLTSSGKSGSGTLSWYSAVAPHHWQWSNGGGDSQFLDHGIGTTVTCTIS